MVVVVATVTDGVCVGYFELGGIRGYGAVAPCIVEVSRHNGTGGIHNGLHVALQIPLEVVQGGCARGGVFPKGIGLGNPLTKGVVAVTYILLSLALTVKKKPPRL